MKEVLDMATTLDRFKRTLSDVLVLTDRETAGLTDRTNLIELGVDSLDKMSLICDVEGEFDIDLPDDAAFETTGEWCKYIDRNRVQCRR